MFNCTARGKQFFKCFTSKTRKGNNLKRKFSSTTTDVTQYQDKVDSYDTESMVSSKLAEPRDISTEIEILDLKQKKKMVPKN